MGKTTIEWTDSTWNPIRGCTRISPGCQNCYAERMAARALPAMNSPATGKSFAIMTPSGPRWTGNVELIESKLPEPLKWRTPRVVFVNSISDTFHASVPLEWQVRIFEIIRSCPRHYFLILSKRVANMLERMPAIMAALGIDAPLPNVGLGVSVEDQQHAFLRVPQLLATPAAMRFVSAEPMLGPIYPAPSVDWIIIGGESGPGARPCAVEDIEALAGECAEYGVACFIKQLGANVAGPILRHPKGGDLDEWPVRLRVRQFPPAMNAWRCHA